MWLHICVSAPNLTFPFDNFDNEGASQSTIIWFVRSASLAPGYHGQALYTRSSRQYIEMDLDGMNRCLQNPSWCESGITFSFWVMNLPGNTAHDFYPILESNGCGQGQLGFCFGLGLEDFWIVIRASSHVYRNRIPPLEVNEWQHVTFTFIAGGVIKLYVNGCDSTSYRVLEGYQLVTAIRGSATGRSTYFRFGSELHSTQMKLDHVLIWFEVLNVDEIWKLFLQGGIV